jgi:6-phosphogluconolactonase
MSGTFDAVARSVLLLTAATLAAAAPAAGGGPLTVYVGTYTDTTSKGIYRFTLDPETGATTAPVLAIETRNPSFLALHPTGRFLYAVGEMESFEGRKGGAVSAFAIDPKTGGLTLLNQQSSEGSGPCHLVVDKGGKNVLVANYGGGNVAVLPLDEGGRLARASSVAVHEGSGPNKGRQEKPHAHGIYLSADERYAFSPDLGADRVFVYRYDAGKGTLDPHGAGVLPPGSGPRHLAFDSKERHAYVINELLSTITAFAYDAGKGTLTAGETVGTLPAGFAGTSWTAEVAVSPDGRFVYGSNRGHDSLAVFTRDASTGRLAPAGHVPVGGKTPRHFTLDPTGRWLLAGHQGSDTIGVFRVAATTGLPAPAGAAVQGVGKPVCLLLVAR